MALFVRKLGVDLGTANSLVFVPNKGIVLNEPSMVAVLMPENKVLPATITPGEKVEFKIAGKLKDGTVFEGMDAIRVIHKGQISGLSSLLANLYQVISDLLKLLKAY